MSGFEDCGRFILRIICFALQQAWGLGLVTLLLVKRTSLNHLHQHTLRAVITLIRTNFRVSAGSTSIFTICINQSIESTRQ